MKTKILIVNIIILPHSKGGVKTDPSQIEKENNMYCQRLKEKDLLTPIQQLQLQAHKNNGPVINKNKIENFISEVDYPISYFDFETFTDAVPVYDKQRPHMQMPFQYSLHIQKNETKKAIYKFKKMLPEYKVDVKD